MHGGLFLSAFTFIPGPLNIDIDLEFDMIEVELVDIDAIQGTDVNAEPVPEPEPEAEPDPPPQVEEPPVEEPPKEEPPKEEPVVDEGPKRDLGKRKSKVAKLGPPSSNYHVLLSTRNIRKLPFGQDAMDMIKMLPDYDYLVEKGGFDALNDADHFLVASSNLRMKTQTFLAVDCKIPREAVKAKIDTAAKKSNETIEWEDHDGVLSGNPVPADGSPDPDPRHFVLLKENIAVLVRPEFLPAVLGEEVGEEKTAANFVGELTKLRRYARRIPTAGVQFVAHDLHAAFKTKSVGAFALPNDLEFTMEARKNPEFHSRATFQSVTAAKGFMAWWNGEARDLVDGNFTMKLLVGGILDDIEIKQAGREVTIWGELERSQIELILKTVGSVVEKHQAKLNRQQKKRDAAREARQERRGGVPN